MKKVVFIIVLAAVCGGLTPPFAKIALEVFPPFTLIMIRFFFATLVLLPFVIHSKDLNWKIFRKEFFVAFVGALNPMILFIALQFTTASVSPLIYALVPTMTAIYIASVRKQKLSFHQMIGIIVGLCGVVLIVLLPVLQKFHFHLQEFSGNLLILLAALTFFAYSIFSKRKQAQDKVSPMSLTFYFCFVTFIVSLPFVAYEVSRGALIMEHIETQHVLSSLLIGVVGTSIFYLAYQQSLKLSSELTASLFTYLQPVSTIFFAIVLLGEKLTLLFVVGGVLAIVGARFASIKKSDL